ncbi:FunK1 protein kinase, partial [Diaporthe sp. PMI_573]
MAVISRDDRDHIARHPLDNCLHHLHTPLRDAEQSYTSTSSLHDKATDDSQDGRRKTISRLLTALMGAEVALDLYSRASNRNVASELATLLGRVRKGDFSYAHYRPLVSLVIENKSDFEIWSAVLDLITPLSRVTPPASVPTAFDDTPITHSSASQQGGEQTRELVKKRLFEEIRSCTYRSVGGFVQKYFEGKDWTPRTLDIYQAMKSRHKDGRWTDFPNPPVQAEVLDWWFQFQEEFLSDERGYYYTTTSPKDLVGAEAKRQIDLFVKRNDGQTSDSAHDWKDVRVIGELKESNRDKKGTLLQISRYVRDVFSCQPTRRYVHAFTICGREMEVWIFDRSGLYSPGPFDIHDEPERFIQVITGYTMMNEEELGLDTFTERDVDGRFVTLEQDSTTNPTKLRLEPQPITHQRAIVCRGTSCYLTKTPGSKDHDCVTKFSWTSDRRRPEVDLLRVAHERGVEGIANLVGYRRITSVAEMRSGLTFGEPYSFRGLPSAASSFSQSFSQSQPSFLSGSFSELHGLSIAESPSRKRKSVDVGRKPSKRSRSNSQRSSQHQNEVTYDVEEAQGTSLLAPNSGPYDNRVFRCLVISPAGRAIHNYESPLELLGALRDAIKAHDSLYRKGNILHRDISENNIIIANPKTDGFRGML